MIRKMELAEHERAAGAIPPSGPPEAVIEADDGDVEIIRISPRAYLCAMLSIAWCSIRHPFTTTIIDLSTGFPVEEV